MSIKRHATCRCDECGYEVTALTEDEAKAAFVRINLAVSENFARIDRLTHWFNHPFILDLCRECFATAFPKLRHKHTASALMQLRGVDKPDDDKTAHQRVIRRFGDCGGLANALEIPLAIVHSWYAVGLIPARHQQTVLDTAKRLNIDLRPADFFAVKDAAA